MKKLMVLAMVATLLMAGAAFAAGKNVAAPNATFAFGVIPPGGSAAAASGPTTTNNDDSCDIGVTPAATLLLPYFEVDFASPQTTAQTTLFTITNVSEFPQIAKVTLWTDYSFPVLDFNLFLTGYDVQAINLYDVIGRGIIASTSGTSVAVTPGALSLGNTANPNFGTGVALNCAPGVLPGRIPPGLLTDLRSGLTTGTVSGCGTSRVGGVHSSAIGYATIDVVNNCTQTLPSSGTYYASEILFDNVLIGDYQQVNGDPTVGNFAQGNPMVHIKAVPEGGPAGSVPLPGTTNLPYTFYDRYTPAGNRKIDRRVPLPSTFAARWIEGGTSSFQTNYKIWREGVAVGTQTTACTGAALNSASGITQNFSVAGSHGGLTVVHGGGNALLETSGRMNAANGAGGTGSLTRLDGLGWQEDGFAIGQRVQINGETGTRLVLGFANDPGPFVDPFVNQGTGSVLLLSGGAISAGTDVPRTVHVAEAMLEDFTGPVNVATTSLTRTDGFAWTSEGFSIGQKVWLSGQAGPFTIANLAGSIMTLQGVALTPQTNVGMTVFGYDPNLDGGVRIGGDRITVTGGAGPNSPLVVYGDTSQDGVWYSGNPFDVLGYEFGEKPFNPFVNLPDADNEDDEWVFPLGNPYRFAGNDVIDASALFNLVCDLTCSNLPSVGFTAYGGPADDLIIGSQAGDHLAGGSGNDEIRGLRGVDHIYGDSGVNVDILTRGLSIETTNHSPAPTITLVGFINNGTTIEPTPSPVMDNMDAGRDLIYGEGPGTILGGPQTAYDDIIFGDHGAVIQQVADPNLLDMRL